MATFYLLPSRASLELALSELLERYLPGLPLPADSWDAVIESIKETSQWPEDVYLVPRDDIPDGETIEETLINAYGAETGDRVVEINHAHPQLRSQVWLLRQADVPTITTAR